MNTYRQEIIIATINLKEEIDFLSSIIEERKKILSDIISVTENGTDEDVKLCIEQYHNSVKKTKEDEKEIKNKRKDKGKPKKKGMIYGIRSNHHVFDITCNSFLKRVGKKDNVLDSQAQFTYDSLRRPVEQTFEITF